MELIWQVEEIFTELGSPYAGQARRDRERIGRQQRIENQTEGSA